MENSDICNDCGHSFNENLHGFDQNDGWLDGDKLVHSGSCTYCKFCNPIFAEDLEKVEKK